MRTDLAAYCGASGRDDLLIRWDAERNAPPSPKTVTHGSRRKVWWNRDQGHSWQAAVYTHTTSGHWTAWRQCPEGHLWKAVIFSRAGPQKTGCPVCFGRVNA